jgi:GNAT superfamily N-acetyltransferase
MKIKIRKAKRSDSKEILKLIHELAKFEKLEPPGKAGQKRLIKNAFGKKPLFDILLAEKDENILAYAFYFYTYSSFLARKTLYLEDIFVTESERRSGIGKELFKELIKIAEKKNCGRMEWCVLDWNTKAIEFYNKLGAKPLGDWIYYRKLIEGTKKAKV